MTPRDAKRLAGIRSNAAGASDVVAAVPAERPPLSRVGVAMAGVGIGLPARPGKGP